MRSAVYTELERSLEIHKSALDSRPVLPVCWRKMGLNKNVTRIILDVVMVSLLVLMYEKFAFGIRFHEVGGLAAFGLFIVHNGINRRWIVGITKRLFSGTMPLRVRIGYALNVSLLVSMVFIAVSGTMMSRTVLTGIYGNIAFWRPWHFFASAVALAVVGIHLGLHWSFIRTMFAKMLRVPRGIAVPLGVAVLVGALAFGIFSIVTSEYTVWLMGPFPVERWGFMPGQGLGFYSPGMDSASIAGPLEVVATYGSIVMVIAAAAALTESGLKKLGKRRRAPQVATVPA